MTQLTIERKLLGLLSGIVSKQYNDKRFSNIYTLMNYNTLYFNNLFTKCQCVTRRRAKHSLVITHHNKNKTVYINTRSFYNTSKKIYSSDFNANLKLNVVNSYFKKEGKLKRFLEPILEDPLGVDTSGKTSQHQRSTRIVINQYLMGIKPSVESIYKAIFDLLSKEFTSEIYELINILWDIDAPINYRFYTKVFEMVLDISSEKDLFDLLIFIVKEKPQLGTFLSNWLFKKTIELGNIDLAKSCFSFMFYSGLLRKDANLYGFIRCLNMSNVGILQNCLNPYQLRMLFSVYSKAQNVDAILNLLSLTFTLGLKIEESYYPLFLTPLINYSPDVAIKMVHKLKEESKRTPNIKIYLSLIDGILRKSNDFNLAQNLIDEIPIESRSLHIERVISNIFLQAHFRYHEIEVSLNFYREMCENVGPDRNTFSILFQRFSHYKRAAVDPTYEPNLDRFKYDINRFKVNPDSSLFNMMIKCYLKVNYEKAVRILNEREEAEVKPDRYTYAMFTIFSSKVKKDIPLTLYWFKKIIDSGFVPIAEVVTAVLNLIKKSRDISSVRVVQKLLQKCHYKPNLDEHIDRFVYNVINDIPPVNVRKSKKRWLQVKLN